MATLTTEEQGWKGAAAAHRDESGTGLPLVLAEFDPDNDDDNMAPVYSILKILTHPVAQKKTKQVHSPSPRAHSGRNAALHFFRSIGLFTGTAPKTELTWLAFVLESVSTIFWL
jgi:hypothetical protein